MDKHFLYEIQETARHFYWNIGTISKAIMYLCAIAVMVMLFLGLYKRFMLWRVGTRDARFDRFPERIGDMIRNVFGHGRILRESGRGVGHWLLFFGFLAMAIGTAVVMLEIDFLELVFGVQFIKGPFYTVFSLILDVMGVAALVGLTILTMRRYGTKPPGLDNKREDIFAIALIYLILVTGFLNEGFRIGHRLAGPEAASWAFERIASPVGYLLALMFKGIGQKGLEVLHFINWWVHAAGAFVFIGFLASTKLLHIVSSSINTGLIPTGPKGMLRSPGDLDQLMEEGVETFGVNALEQYTWKDLFDSDACTRCGRCQDYCATFNTDKPLSPKKLIQDLRAHMSTHGALMVAKRLTETTNGAGEAVVANGNGSRMGALVNKIDKLVGPILFRKEIAALKAAGDGEGDTGEGLQPIIGPVISDEELWACGTCKACMENCPVCIEHIDKIIELRRYKVQMEGDFAPEAQVALRNIENNSNPWGIGFSERAKWAKDLDVPILGEMEDPSGIDYLYYVGCAGAFDERGSKVATALVKILKAAGVSFGILGTEEGCCGDQARRIGNEYLYQTLAKQNIETFKNYGVTKIVVACPHGYNCIKNEYPEFGGNFEVVHSSQLISDLIIQGRLKLNKGNGMKVALHDSCYLGRYNEIYEEPRRLIKATGAEMLEIGDRHHRKSFCCGAGGGRMWFEETEGQKIYEVRTGQAIDTGCNTVGVACPFCLTMFEDGVKVKDNEEVKVLDIVEIVAKALD